MQQYDERADECADDQPRHAGPQRESPSQLIAPHRKDADNSGVPESRIGQRAEQPKTGGSEHRKRRDEQPREQPSGITRRLNAKRTKR